MARARGRAAGVGCVGRGRVEEEEDEKWARLACRRPRRAPRRRFAVVVTDAGVGALSGARARKVGRGVDEGGAGACLNAEKEASLLFEEGGLLG